MFTKAITKKPCRALIDEISTAQFGEGTPVYDKEPSFAEFNRFVIDPDELYAINSLYINGTVLVPE